MARIACPQCGHNDCSETVEEYTTRHYCFRASCGYRAQFSTNTGLKIHFEKRKDEDPGFKGELNPVRDENADWLMTRFGISSGQIDLYMRETGSWYAIRIEDSRRAPRGWVLRWPWDSPNAPSPKTKTYLDDAKYTGMAWFLSFDRYYGPLVLVEDPMSAMRLQGQDVDAVALLGTNLSMQKVSEIQRVSRNVTIALDNDATAQSFELVKEWRPAFETLTTTILPDHDIKDMPEREFNEFCTRLRSNNA